jgi:hypothetical protein
VRLNGQGLSVDVPDGWDGEIFRRDPDPAIDADLTSETRPELTGAVLHVANFPLPSQRGDFGSGAVEVMRRQDVLVVLKEYDPESAKSALYRHRLTLPLDADIFDPQRLQRVLPNQGGAQVFFSEAGRAFCLYIVLGSFRLRARLLPEVNALLKTLEIT